MKTLSHLSIFIWLLSIALISCNQMGEKNPGQKIADIELVDTTNSEVLSSEDKNSTAFDSIAPNMQAYPEAIPYILDTDSSKISWHCVIHTGYTKLKKGKVLIANGNIVGGDFEICMDSINDVDIDYQLMKDVLVNTLKSPDFFYIEKFPYAHFDLVRVKRISEDHYEVVGNLTIKEVTNQIRFKSNIQDQDSLIIVESERFSIDRTKWGITLYSRNFEQTDDRFLFTDFVEIQISLQFR